MGTPWQMHSQIIKGKTTNLAPINWTNYWTLDVHDLWPFPFDLWYLPKCSRNVMLFRLVVHQTLVPSHSQCIEPPGFVQLLEACRFCDSAWLGSMFVASIRILLGCCCYVGDTCDTVLVGNCFLFVSTLINYYDYHTNWLYAYIIQCVMYIKWGSSELDLATQN